MLQTRVVRTKLEAGNSFQRYHLAVRQLMEALDGKREEGHIIFVDYPVVRIKYNLQNGKIKLIEGEKKKKSPYIKFIFDKKAFPFLVEFVADAMTLLIKRHLLIGLDALGDANICWLINKYHRQHHQTTGPFIHLTLAEVDHTLVKIIKFDQLFLMPKFLYKKSISPLHEAVAILLEKIGLRAFNSQAALQIFFGELQQGGYAK